MNTELNTELNTPTPRTDAAVKLTCAAGHNTVCLTFARTLERELNAERKKVEGMTETCLKLLEVLTLEREEGAK